MKREDNRAENRAKTFLNDNAGVGGTGGGGLRKNGTIEKKDLSKNTIYINMIK